MIITDMAFVKIDNIILIILTFYIEDWYNLGFISLEEYEPLFTEKAITEAKSLETGAGRER